MCLTWQNRATIVDFFLPYGEIEETKFFPNQKIMYVKYKKREQACKAIIEMTGKTIQNEIVKCNWGSMPSEPEDHFDSRELKYSEVISLYRVSS